MALGGSVLAPPRPPRPRPRRRLRQRRVLLLLQQQQAGSVSDFTGSVADYGTKQPSCYDFKGAGNGKGMCVKNDAASVWNRSSKTVRVYFNSNFAGSDQDFAAGRERQPQRHPEEQQRLAPVPERHRRPGARPTARTAGCPRRSSSTGSPQSGGPGRVQDLRQERPAQRVGVELAEGLARGRGDGRQELRLVLGAALDPQDAERRSATTSDHTATRCTGRLGDGVDERRGGRDVGHPDDAQREHPPGPLLLDDDGVRRLGQRRLDVAVRLARQGQRGLDFQRSCTTTTRGSLSAPEVTHQPRRPPQIRGGRRVRGYGTAATRAARSPRRAPRARAGTAGRWPGSCPSRRCGCRRRTRRGRAGRSRRPARRWRAAVSSGCSSPRSPAKAQQPQLSGTVTSSATASASRAQVVDAAQLRRGAGRVQGQRAQSPGLRAAPAGGARR